MIRRLAAAAAGVALSVPLTVATAGSAWTAEPTKGACVQAGLGTLKSLGGVSAFANGYDYSPLSGPSGPIFAPLTPGTELKLGPVVKLHTSSPSAFQWCRDLVATP